MEPVKSFVDLTIEVKELEAVLEEKKKARDKAEREALDYMAGQGLENVRLNGYTVFPTRKVWARLGNHPMAFEILEANGLGPIITQTVNANTLSKHIRGQLEELAEISEALPEELIAALEKKYDGAVNITAVIQLTARKAS